MRGFRALRLCDLTLAFWDLAGLTKDFEKIRSFLGPWSGATETHYLEGDGGLVSVARTRRSHTVTPSITIINLLMKSL